jgi:hypothetical protein
MNTDVLFPYSASQYYIQYIHLISSCSTIEHTFVNAFNSICIVVYKPVAKKVCIVQTSMSTKYRIIHWLTNDSHAYTANTSAWLCPRHPLYLRILLRTCSRVKSEGLGFSLCAAPLTWVCAPNFRGLLNNVRRLSDDVWSPMSDAREFRQMFGNKW